ncbi:MAG TPA: hypothetical protein VF306_01565 [Pirellulales bacterium]
MSTDDRYEWRETYFVLFPSEKRPSLGAVEKAVRKVGAHLQFSGQEADDQGRIEAINVQSPGDYSALEIDYHSGDEVTLQVEELTQQLRSDRAERDRLARLKACDARFEIMHFEIMAEDMSSDENDEVFDPSALLVVLDALVELTDGVGVDPQSGTLL